MMTITHGAFIDGQWTDTETDETFVVRNPADPDEVVTTYQVGNERDAERAVQAAADAQSMWSAKPGPARGAILHQTAELLAERTEKLARTLTIEEGKTLSEATDEVQRAVDIFRYYAQKARDIGGSVSSASHSEMDIYTKREPIGVAGLITPWNYPIAIPAWKIAPALASGSSVILNPSTDAPSVSRELFECLNDAGLPSGVANFVPGPGRDVGETLVTHTDVDAVSFTGSTTVGKRVYKTATDNGKRTQCEMGGKNPTMVMPSASIEDAVEIVGGGAFGVTGQACTATSRAIVHEAVYDTFKDAIVAYADDLEVGPGLTDPDMGPQANHSELESTLEYVDVGIDNGATLETGGSRLTNGSTQNGYFVEPTVFAADPDMRIAQEEIFGPVLTLIRVSSFEEGLAIANNVDYGLSASIVTNDLEEANRFVNDIEAGVVKVNETTTGVELHVPFGGYKQSSTNTYREQGDAALDFFTTTKTAYVSY